ncbi:hypothetical protein SNE40_021423 [Patella caerulea]|uniref:Fibrinogen C-terminal domain-containing protein n=1 Tax=Patella caerulea TaxID=87958 RepID=A0AAN8G7Y0_PATCE
MNLFVLDCKEGRDKNVTPAGIILLSFIQPSVNGPVVEVKCDFRSSTRTYVYIRETNCLEIDGNKTFNEYSNGFGHTVGNYFLGLEHIYNILQIGYFSMGIRFEFDGQVAKGYYHKFVIDSKANNYRLSIGFFQNDSAFSCGDSVINGAFSLNGRPFSTLDHDLTNHSCPVRFGGGWWYLDNHVCSRSNVNGRRSGNNFESTWHWQDTLGKTTSFSSMNMFLRYKNNQS